MRYRVVRNRWTLAGLTVVTLLGCAALGAPWLAPGDPTRGDLTAALRSPSTTYLLGTDAQGRDVLSRVLFGARLSLAVVCVVIGLVGWAGMARLVRGQVLVARGLDYVQAARALGASDARLVARHLLPNVLGPVIIAATLGVGGAIMAEAALSFVGLGAQPPTPSWGAMIAEGRDLLRVAPWVSLFPGLAIGAAVLGLNLLGDGLRDALDVRAQTRIA